MTKNEIISEIRTLLWDGKEGGGSGDVEVIVKDIHGGFRNGRWGMQGYALCLIEGEVYVRPWSNSHIHWQVRLEECLKKELEEILDRLEDVIHSRAEDMVLN